MKILLTILFFALGIQAQSRTLAVGKGQPYTTIRAAVAAAAHGDTVLVKQGLYYVNNIIVTKSLTIIGEGWPILHGADKYELLTLSGNRITVKGFQLTNSGYSAMNDYAAIKVIDATNITVEGNRFFKAYFGVHVANTTQSTIRGNYFFGLTKSENTTGNGIHLWKCNNMLVEGNEVHGHRDGIYFEFVTHSLVRNNKSEGNLRYGLHFMFSNDDTYVANTFQNNGAGVAVMYSKRVTMLRNQFINNWGPAAYGLLLKDINDSRIEGNRFYKNTVGILMEGTSRIQATQNSFEENGWAAKVAANCMDNAFNQNNFQRNTFDVSTNGSLVLNDFNHNYWDKYEGYDRNRDGVGDIPYHPVSMYAAIIETNPNALMLLRSFMVTLLEKAEKALPSLTPENLKDDRPLLRAIKLSNGILKQ
jgi:nitrous oxidase accessory protein